ncbi:hypothetical protein LZZ90_13875, partial [Flavobacterium sp. SM15]|nr:hypothetical protein [Flavobacterium sp. SM15]
MKNNYLVLFFVGLLFGIYNTNGQAPPNLQVTTSGSLQSCNPGGAVVLNCTNTSIYNTNSYSVSPISINSPVGTYPPSAAGLYSDDNWSNIYDIKLGTPQPFNFCFWGQTFQKLLLNSNGVISFSINGVVPGGAYGPGDGTGWSLAGNPLIPSVNGGGGPLYRNAIHGVFQDTYPNPAPSVDVNFAVQGTYPNRMFVFNMNNVPNFSCGSVKQTSQIIMYEATNIIDVYVIKRDASCTWNGGKGTLGIQNNDGTQGLAPPGRNTGAWSAGVNGIPSEAWRFSPSASEIIPTYVWKDQTGAVVGNTKNPTVYPTTTTTYNVEVTYNICGVNYTITAPVPVTVTMLDVPTGTTPTDLTECDTDANPGTEVFDLTTTMNNYLGILDPFQYSISLHTSLIGAQTGTDIIPESDWPAYTSPTATLYAVIQDNFTAFSCKKIKTFQVVVDPCEVDDLLACDTDSNGSETFDIAVQDSEVLLPSENASDFVITYHTTLASADGSGPFNPIPPGNTLPTQLSSFVSSGQTIYVRKQKVSDGSFVTTNFDLVVNPIPSISGTTTICVNETSLLSGSGTPATTNAWTSSDNAIAAFDPTLPAGTIKGISAGTVTVTYTDANGCLKTTSVTVNPIPDVVASPSFQDICSGTAPNILLSSAVSGTTFA